MVFFRRYFPGFSQFFSSSFPFLCASPYGLYKAKLAAPVVLGGRSYKKLDTFSYVRASSSDDDHDHHVAVPTLLLKNIAVRTHPLVLQMLKETHSSNDDSYTNLKFEHYVNRWTHLFVELDSMRQLAPQFDIMKSLLFTPAYAHQKNPFIDAFVAFAALKGHNPDRVKLCLLDFGDLNMTSFLRPYILDSTKSPFQLVQGSNWIQARGLLTWTQVLNHFHEWLFYLIVFSPNEFEALDSSVATFQRINAITVANFPHNSHENIRQAILKSCSFCDAYDNTAKAFYSSKAGLVCHNYKFDPAFIEIFKEMNVSIYGDRGCPTHLLVYPRPRLSKHIVQKFSSAESDFTEVNMANRVSVYLSSRSTLGLKDLAYDKSSYTMSHNCSVSKVDGGLNQAVSSVITDISSRSMVVVAPPSRQVFSDGEYEKGFSKVAELLSAKDSRCLSVSARRDILARSYKYGADHCFSPYYNTVNGRYMVDKANVGSSLNSSDLQVSVRDDLEALNSFTISPGFSETSDNFLNVAVFDPSLVSQNSLDSLD